MDPNLARNLTSGAGVGKKGDEYDAQGAMYFTVVTVCVYGLSIIFSICGHISKREVSKEENHQIDRYLKHAGEFQFQFQRDEVLRLRAKWLADSLVGMPGSSNYERRLSRAHRPRPTHGLTGDSSGLGETDSLAPLVTPDVIGPDSSSVPAWPPCSRRMRRNACIVGFTPDPEQDSEPTLEPREERTSSSSAPSDLGVVEDDRSHDHNQPSWIETSLTPGAGDVTRSSPPSYGVLYGEGLHDASGRLEHELGPSGTANFPDNDVDGCVDEGSDMIRDDDPGIRLTEADWNKSLLGETDNAGESIDQDVQGMVNNNVEYMYEHEHPPLSNSMPKISQNCLDGYSLLSHHDLVSKRAVSSNDVDGVKTQDGDIKPVEDRATLSSGRPPGVVSHPGHCEGRNVNGTDVPRSATSGRRRKRGVCHVTWSVGQGSEQAVDSQKATEAPRNGTNSLPHPQPGESNKGSLDGPGEGCLGVALDRRLLSVREVDRASRWSLPDRVTSQASRDIPQVHLPDRRAMSTILKVSGRPPSQPDADLAIPDSTLCCPAPQRYISFRETGL